MHVRKRSSRTQEKDKERNVREHEGTCKKVRGKAQME